MAVARLQLVSVLLSGCRRQRQLPPGFTYEKVIGVAQCISVGWREEEHPVHNILQQNPLLNHHRSNTGLPGKQQLKRRVCVRAFGIFSVDTESVVGTATETEEDDRGRRVQQRRRGSSTGEEEEAGAARLHGGGEGRGATITRAPDCLGDGRGDQRGGKAEVDKEPDRAHSNGEGRPVCILARLEHGRLGPSVSLSLFHVHHL